MTLPLPAPSTVIDRLAPFDITSKHFDAARAFEARGGQLVAGFEERTAELRAALVEDLAAGTVELEQAMDRAGALVLRHAVAAPAVVHMAGKDVVEAAQVRCRQLAWEALRLAGPEVDRETRGRLAALGEQIGKLEAQLPEDMRGGSLPASAGRKLIGIWSDLIGARQRRDELVGLRAELRIYGLVEATDVEAEAERVAEEWRLRRVRGEISYRMETPDRLAADALVAGDAMLAPGAPGTVQIMAVGARG